MPTHPFQKLQGHVEHFTLKSDHIQNLWGDPTERNIAVYLPPSNSSSTKNKTYPWLLDLAGFTGSAYSHLSWSAFKETLPQRYERLRAQGLIGDCILVMPDCFTSVGGNQYINSSAAGQWADFLTLDLIPAIEARYPVLKGREYRAVFGKSSGGYGSLVHGMLYAQHWGAVACHSGDMGFEHCFLSDFPKVLMTLQDTKYQNPNYSNPMEAFVREFWKNPKLRGEDFHTLMILAMGLFFDPEPARPLGLQLPVDTHTCAVIPERWQQWLNWDPVHMIERTDIQNNLRSLKGLYIDCGSKDQYNLLFGARQLQHKLQALNIEHHYEEFPDTHGSIDYRMDLSLPWLYKKLLGV